MKKFTKIRKIITALIVSVAVFFSGQVFLPANFSRVKAAEDGNISRIVQKQAGDYYANEFANNNDYYFENSIENNISSYTYSINSLSNDGRKYNFSNDVYSWTAGSNLLNDNGDLNTLIYRFDSANPSYLEIPYNKNIQGATGEYHFTLYRCGDDGKTSEAILELYVEIYPQLNAFFIFIKRYKYGTETLGISGFERNVFNGDFNENLGSVAYESINDIAKENSDASYFAEMIESSEVEENTEYSLWDLVYYSNYDELDYYKAQNENINLPFYGENEKFFYLIVGGLDFSNKYNGYFINFECKSGFGFIDADYETQISSSITSVYSVCDDMYSREHLSESGANSNVQNAIVDMVKNGKLRDIQISYLVQIGDTPFATKKTSWVKVPVANNRVDPKDICVNLGLDTLSVGQSPCNSFLINPDTGIYDAYYYKNVWLNAKSVDGNNMNYFLDINKSFRDYYLPFLNDSIMSSEMFEWLFSSIISLYPEVGIYGPDEVYGYFGYCVVPDTYSFNQLISEMFNSVNLYGICKKFSYRGQLKYDDYQKLLNDYQYVWLETAWNTVAGFVSGSYSAEHYFFYVDGKQDTYGIWENGATDVNDNNGALFNKVESLLDGGITKIIAIFAIVLILVLIGPIFSLLGKLISLLLKVLKLIFKFIWSILTFPFRLLKPK